MTHYLLYCKDDILLTPEGDVPSHIPASLTLKPWQHVTTIEQGEHTYNIERLDAPYRGDDLVSHPLRATHAILSTADYLTSGKGAELTYWDSAHKYCGVCGAPLRWKTSISKQCPGCGKEIWPSPSVAVIVRVRRNDKILLVQSRSFRDDRYGLVAGFVETGESLEQCVEREVKEETGLEISDVTYFGSQPWPFPFTLMAAFTADYRGGELTLQRQELNKGGWFGSDSLPHIPDKASIARRLIDDWLESGQQKK